VIAQYAVVDAAAAAAEADSTGGQAVLVDAIAAKAAGPAPVAQPIVTTTASAEATVLPGEATRLAAAASADSADSVNAEASQALAGAAADDDTDSMPSASYAAAGADAAESSDSRWLRVATAEPSAHHRPAVADGRIPAGPSVIAQADQDVVELEITYGAEANSSRPADADELPQSVAASAIEDEDAGRDVEPYGRVAAARRFSGASVDAHAVTSAALDGTARSGHAAEPADTSVENGLRPAALLDRVAGQIRVAAEAGGGEATLKLEPESLGRVEVSVRVQDGQVSVSLSADSAAVQQARSDRLSDLVQALSATGMTVAQANVDIGDRAQRHQSWGHQASQGAAESDEEAVTGPSSADWLQPLSLLDLRA